MDFSKPAPVNINALFGGSLQHVPGVGYVNATQGGTAAVNGLGDEAAVMMISGVDERVQSASVDVATFTLSKLLTQPVKIGPVTQPLWVWLLAACGAAGFAGWWFFAKRK